MDAYPPYTPLPPHTPLPTTQTGTFEVVRSNLYTMLAELARTFNPTMLDALFFKFERRTQQSTRPQGAHTMGPAETYTHETCTHTPGPSAGDTLQLIEVMRRFAQGDTGAIMADRVLRLLWDLIMEPNAPGEVVHCKALQEVCEKGGGGGESVCV